MVYLLLIVAFFVCLDLCNGSCQNGGTCVAPNTCSCPRGWTGDFCQTCKIIILLLSCIIINFSSLHVFPHTSAQCSPSCQNGGTCIPPDRCSCPDGWTGRDCAIRKSFMKSSCIVHDDHLSADTLSREQLCAIHHVSVTEEHVQHQTLAAV